MSLIEQAAKRLEQLRQAGVELPEDAVARDQLQSASTTVTNPCTKSHGTGYSATNFQSRPDYPAKRWQGFGFRVIRIRGKSGQSRF